LVGPNGAGKSTTIRIMLNLTYPDSGEVEVLGLAQPSQEMEIKCLVGYVPESPSFYEDMTVGWTAGLVSAYYPGWDPELYEEYLMKFELNPNKKVRQLSKGMRMKLALTLALSHRPRLLILDEPTSGLDPVVRRELLETIADLIRDEGRTVIFSSHITQDVEQVADYVAVLHRGQLALHSDKETLLHRWRKVSGTQAITADIKPLFRAVRTDGHSFIAITDSYSPGWVDRVRAAGITDLRISRASLEEVLLTVVGKEI